MSTVNIQDISPNEAWELLQKQPQAVLLDVRSTMEYEYVGHPVGATHIPWKEPPDWEDDPQFVAKVKAALSGRAEGEPESLPVHLPQRQAFAGGGRGAVAPGFS